MSENFYKKNPEEKDKMIRYKTSDLNLDALFAEISALEVKKKGGIQKLQDISFNEEDTKEELNSEEDNTSENDFSETEEFNAVFDKELDENFISRDSEMIGKSKIPVPPEIPEIPYFPTISDIENFLEQKIPEVPNHFTIEVPPEFEEIVPPEPLGAPPPPPVPPEGRDW